MAVAKLQPVQPIATEFAETIRRVGVPKRYITLRREKFTGAVVRCVVHEEKMADAKVTVVIEDIRETQAFVAHS